ncbi:MAG: hypothetical protein FWH29_00145 [Methanobrevibacter sp.]|nr:hypothetical protein [Methanobrevibacter sp.]
MGDEGLKASMKNLELAFQNGAFDQFFKEKIEEMHLENVMNERLEKTREEKGKEIAIKLKNEGIPMETIAKATSLSLSQIKKL